MKIANMGPELKSCQIYVKLCTPANLKVLNRNLTLYLKSKFRELSVKIKISSDLLKKVNNCQFEGGEYESDWI